MVKQVGRKLKHHAPSTNSLSHRHLCTCTVPSDLFSDADTSPPGPARAIQVVLLQPFAEKQNFPIRPIKRGSCVSLCNPRPSIFSMAYGRARRTCIRVLTGREREIGGLTTANKRRGAGRGLSNALAEGMEFLIARQIQSPDTDNTNPSPENSAGSFKRCYFRADDTSPQTVALPRSKRILNPYS
jgi:hypothetical protein